MSVRTQILVSPHAVRTLLIIGGTGFFGKSILDAYLAGALAPWQIGKIIIMARHATILPQRITYFAQPTIEWLDADITSCDVLPAADIVIHAAASTDARDYLLQPAQQRENIIAGTLNYCRLAPQFHADSLIVYASSGAVYGQLEPRIAVDENTALRPIETLPAGKQSYAAAKRDAEAAVRNLAQHGMRVSIARCFAFMGRWLPRDQHFAIGNFMQNVLDGQSIEVKATRPVYRSYMHAQDLVTWLMTIASVASTDCPVYNVGSDEALEMGEIAARVAHAGCVPLQLATHTETEPDWYIPSIAHARQLGLELQYTFDQAVALTLDALRAR